MTSWRAGGDSRCEDVVELLVVVLVHADVFARPEATHEPVVDTTEELFFFVGDTDNRELRQTVEVVDDSRVFELVDLVEDYDRPRSIVLLQSIDELVVRGRLAMNVDGLPEVVENLIQRPEPGVVAPAVDVGRFDVEGLLPEAFGHELRDAGLAGAARPGHDSRLCWLTAREWFENAREVVDLGVAMLDFPGTNPARSTRASRIICF